MIPMNRVHAVLIAVVFVWLFSLSTHAANAPSLEERLQKLEQTAGNTPSISAGDNAWMLASSALVLMMTAPGLILFYGGLVRRKNVLATMMHSLVLMAVMSVLWVVYGYSLAFSEGSPFFGGLGYFFLNGVGTTPNTDYAATIPHQTFMLFQMMFVIITPALISGAVAERMKFSAYLLFMILWVTIVYLPLAHMVWGKGGFFNWALGGRIPVLDFAGGTVVHISSGVSALVCAIVLGKRSGFPQEPMMPHNVVLSLIGTGLLWVGWFGFNAGSALGAGEVAVGAFAATHFSAAAGALGWMGLEWFLKRKPSVLGAASGMLAGLATSTPASCFVTIPSALLIGLTGGMFCYLAVTYLKAKCGYDDSLDVFGVHCVGSTVGMLMLGILANPTVNPLIASTFKQNDQVVSFAGGASQLGNQLVGFVVTIALAALGTFLILAVLKATIGLRVSDEEEVLGLDLTQHGERAYND